MRPGCSFFLGQIKETSGAPQTRGVHGLGVHRSESTETVTPVDCAAESKSTQSYREFELKWAHLVGGGGGGRLQGPMWSAVGPGPGLTENSENCSGMWPPAGGNVERAAEGRKVPVEILLWTRPGLSQFGSDSDPR